MYIPFRFCCHPAQFYNLLSLHYKWWKNTFSEQYSAFYKCYQSFLEIVWCKAHFKQMLINNQRFLKQIIKQYYLQLKKIKFITNLKQNVLTKLSYPKNFCYKPIFWWKFLYIKTTKTSVSFNSIQKSLEVNLSYFKSNTISKISYTKIYNLRQLTCSIANTTDLLQFQCCHASCSYLYYLPSVNLTAQLFEY